MPTYEHDGTMARFADQAAGLSITKLLSNQASFHMKISPNAKGEIFLFASESYKTQLTISNGEVAFSRNEHVARKQVRPVQRHYQILCSWRPDKFQLALMIDDEVGGDDACVTVETRPIYIPTDAITWARRYSLLSRSTFSSPAEFLGVVVESIQQVNRTIRKGNSIQLYWDRQRSQTAAPKLVPKREPEVMAGIGALIQDQSLLAGYELIQESAASTGSLDLRAIGPNESGGTTTICIEGKNAHSDDLDHEITDQLPEYMDASGASYGIYLVLWYRCDEFKRSSEDGGDITWGLTMKRPWENIVIEKFDLSLPKSPSDKSFKYGE